MLYSSPVTTDPTLQRTYIHGHAPAVVQQHAKRTADEAAAFLLPKLLPEMRLLDVGCGPGSITIGLAQYLKRGEVIGVDLGRETLELARRDAEARGISNLRYEYADAYDLPLPGQFLRCALRTPGYTAPQRTSTRARRDAAVLKPAGLIALRDVDWGTAVY